MKKVSTVAANESRNISPQKLTIGLDLGDRKSWYCVVDEAGQIQVERRVRTTARELREVFGGMPRSRIAHNYLGQAGVAAYAATKGGVVSMARSIAADLAPRNIRVNVVAPGATKTPIWKRGPRASISTDESAKLAKFVSSVIPLGRWGEAEDVAKAVLFLASEDSSYVNAVALMVDGGATGAPFGAPILRG